MYGLRNINTPDLPISHFLKYGLEVYEDGSVKGPKKPQGYGYTPQFSFKDSQEHLLVREKLFLDHFFLKDFSVIQHQKSILSIVNNIFQQVTGKPYTDVANIVIMSQKDFQIYLKLISKKLQDQRGVGGNIHGFNLGGLIIVQESGGNACFPLIFHELGHNLYPDEFNTYIDEFRAMYFQIVCTKKLEQELAKIGIQATYPDNYYEETDLPSHEHKKAYDDARLLYNFQKRNGMGGKDNPRAEKMLCEFLEIVKQDT